MDGHASPIHGRRRGLLFNKMDFDIVFGLLVNVFIFKIWSKLYQMAINVGLNFVELYFQPKLMYVDMEKNIIWVLFIIILDI